MNKSDLVEAVATELGTSKAAAAKAVEAVLAAAAQGLRRDGALAIVGFGAFTRKQRPARMGRNPSNGQPLKIAASITVAFKPSQALKDLCQAAPARQFTSASAR